MIKVIRSLFQKPSFVCHYRQKTYKIFTIAGSPFRKAEIAGNQNALRQEFWRHEVIEVKPRLFYIEMARGKPILPGSYEETERLMEDKLQNALTYPKKQASDMYDFSYLSRLESYGLKRGLLDQAKEVLSTVSLPVTSAHGDLHLGNMIRMGQAIKIIDWSMFSGKGSFITDYIHFYNYLHAEKTKASWTQSIVEEHQYLDALAHQLGLQTNHLRLAYSLSRISGATTQRKNLKQVPSIEIAKYNFVLTQIFKTLPKDAIV